MLFWNLATSMADTEGTSARRRRGVATLMLCWPVPRQPPTKCIRQVVQHLPPFSLPSSSLACIISPPFPEYLPSSFPATRVGVEGEGAGRGSGEGGERTHAKAEYGRKKGGKCWATWRAEAFCRGLTGDPLANVTPMRENWKPEAQVPTTKPRLYPTEKRQWL